MSMFYARMGKRLFDIMCGLIGLVLLSPIILLTVVFVRVKLGSPVLFRQQRPGLYGQPFTIYKFRTMTNALDETGRLLPDAQRLTSFGKFLRSTSLDELPELVNILKGEMSFVGPRPLLMRYLERYTTEQLRRQDVKPGLTGWAQVNGRNAISWQQRFELDVWYTQNVSLKLDLKILLMTLVAVLSRRDVSQAGQATIEEFMGSE